MHSTASVSKGFSWMTVNKYHPFLVAFDIWLPYELRASRERRTMLKTSNDQDGIRVDVLREGEKWIMCVRAGVGDSPSEHPVFAEVAFIDAIEAEGAVQHQVVIEVMMASGSIHVWVNGVLEGMGNGTGHSRWSLSTEYSMSTPHEQPAVRDPRINTGVREYRGVTFDKCPHAVKVLRGDWVRLDSARSYACLHGNRRRLVEKWEEDGDGQEVNDLRYHPMPAELVACKDTDRAGECTYLKQQAAVDVCMAHFNISAGHGREVCSDPYFGGSTRCCYNELTGLCLTCRFFAGPLSPGKGAEAPQHEPGHGNCSRALASCGVRYLSQCGFAEGTHPQSPQLLSYIGLSSQHVSTSFVARRDSCIRTAHAGFWRHPPYVFRGDFFEIRAFNTDLRGCADACDQSDLCSLFEYGQTDYVCRYAPQCLLQRANVGNVKRILLLHIY